MCFFLRFVMFFLVWISVPRFLFRAQPWPVLEMGIIPSLCFSRLHEILSGGNMSRENTEAAGKPRKG